MYLHDFSESKLEGLRKEFSVTEDALVGFEVLLASYYCESYGGGAFVLLRRSDGKLFEVNASHCSCFDLEGQWGPEETSVSELRRRLEDGTFGTEGKLNIFRKELLSVLGRPL